MNNNLPAYFMSYKPVLSNANVRFPRYKNSSAKKVYCDNCVRYGIIKILNLTVSGPTSIDTDLYETSFTYNKLLCKPSAMIKDIIKKVDTHSIDGYKKYIKIRFMELYC